MRYQNDLFDTPLLAFLHIIHLATNLVKIENLINIPPNTPIQIGSDIYETYKPEGDTKNRKYPFNGEIYVSRVYNRPLAEQEVLYNYNTTVNNSK